MSEFKYLRRVLDESGTDVAECRRKVASERKVEGAIRTLVNGRGLQLESSRDCSRQFCCMAITQ